jgi:hypothetical protein
LRFNFVKRFGREPYEVDEFAAEYGYFDLVPLVSAQTCDQLLADYMVTKCNMIAVNALLAFPIKPNNRAGFKLRVYTEVSK